MGRQGVSSESALEALPAAAPHRPCISPRSLGFRMTSPSLLQSVLIAPLLGLGWLGWNTVLRLSCAGLCPIQAPVPRTRVSDVSHCL